MVSNHVVFVISPEDEKLLRKLVSKTGLNRTQIMRKALKQYEPKFQGSTQKAGRPKKSSDAVGNVESVSKNVDNLERMGGSIDSRTAKKSAKYFP